MGLYKRHQVWWMSVMYQGREVRRSTGTTDRRLAEAIWPRCGYRSSEGGSSRREKKRAGPLRN